MIDLRTSLPKTVQISAYKFKVRFVPRTDPILADEDGNQRADGITNFDVCEICLSESMQTQRLAIVAMHEILHVINWAYGVNDGAEEEHVTTQVAIGFIDLMRNNPKWTTWFNRAVREMRK